MINDHVISMPDKWEYPWFAAWDLAFHTHRAADRRHRLRQAAARSAAAASFYLHPTGQIPAYEWNFSDVNPPVHAWATIFLYRMEQALRGADRSRFPEAGLRQAARRISAGGSTARTASARTSSRAAFSGSTISASSTAARRCRPAAISSRPTAPRGWRCSARTCSRSASSWPRTTRPTRTWRPSSASSSCWIARAMNAIGPDGMWDEEDGFYYDVLRLPDGSATPPQGPLDGRPAAAVRHDRRRTVAARARAQC